MKFTLPEALWESVLRGEFLGENVKARGGRIGSNVAVGEGVGVGRKNVPGGKIGVNVGLAAGIGEGRKLAASS